MAHTDTSLIHWITSRGNTPLSDLQDSVIKATLNKIILTFLWSWFLAWSVWRGWYLDNFNMMCFLIFLYPYELKRCLNRISILFACFCHVFVFFSLVIYLTSLWQGHFPYSTFSQFWKLQNSNMSSAYYWVLLLPRKNLGL